MKHLATWITIVGATWVVAGGCATTGSGSARASASPPLAGTAWQLVRFQGGDDRVLVPASNARYTIAFAEGGRLSARVFCNRGAGTWTSEAPGALTFGPLALTRAACPPDPMQDHLLKQWEWVRSYVVRDGKLYLSLFADGGIYEFAAAENRAD